MNEIPSQQTRRPDGQAVTPPSGTKQEGTLDAVVQATEQRKTLVRSASAFLGIAPERIWDVLAGIWTTSKGQPSLSKQEMFTGLAIIARFHLDPFSKEIYVTRDKKGRLMTVVGIDGWVKILHRTDYYDGPEVEFGWKDQSETDLVWVETTLHSKKHKHPTKYRAFMDEYLKLGGFQADRIPKHMLRIFSLRHAARLFVPLGGTVLTEEEAAWMMKDGDAEPDPTPLPEHVVPFAEDDGVQPEPADDGSQLGPDDVDPDQRLDEFLYEIDYAISGKQVDNLVGLAEQDNAVNDKPRMATINEAAAKAKAKLAGASTPVAQREIPY